MSELIVPIIRFENPLEQLSWKSIDDVVMGGRSQSQMVITNNKTALFEGHVSLENFGGFASIRSLPQLHDLSAFQGLQIRVCGDGRIYQMRLISSQNYAGINYVADFWTESNEWQDIRLPFRSFRASFRGMPVPLAPRLKTKHIYTFGFLIAKKQAGNFRLEIDAIQAYQE
jgi:NADH dehydrogenase [ubiquinone] 1 alpha subcomplex assembly factor 1